MKRILLVIVICVAALSVHAQTLTYVQAEQLAIDPTFQTRVQIAISNTAIAIGSEGAGVGFHTQRLAYAVKVLADPVGYAKQLAVGIVSDGIDYGAGTDVTLQNRVNAVWNAYAGAVP